MGPNNLYNRNCFSATKLIITVGLLLIALNLDADETVSIRGEINLDDYGIIKLSECGTNRIIQFGNMAPPQYFVFSRHYHNISSDRANPVLVEAKGNLVQGTSTIDTNLLEDPEVVSLTQGACNETPANTLNETADDAAP